VFAIQIKLANLDNTPMRVTQVGISLLGMILLFAAVYDLSGPRPARLAAWLLAFEPASLFFDSEIHKEPLMVLASGLVSSGNEDLAAPQPRRRAPRGSGRADRDRDEGLRRMVPGRRRGAAAAARRPQTAGPTGRALPIVYAVALAVLLATPTLLAVTSNKSLQTLNQSQAYTTGTQAASNTGGANGDNLADESVDFSSRGAVIAICPAGIGADLQAVPVAATGRQSGTGAVGSLVALGGCSCCLAMRGRAEVTYLP